MHYLMILVFIALLAMAFVNASPVPDPHGEVLVVINQKVQDDCTTSTTAW
ncbi:uncharacterized protein LOC108035119 [Drosophila biarmipes]|nr:uncharacterized protein LOC108035119 [Drosophila biarmipes]